MEIGEKHSTARKESERRFTTTWINLTFRGDFKIFGSSCLRAFYLKGTYLFLIMRLKLVLSVFDDAVANHSEEIFAGAGFVPIEHSQITCCERVREVFFWAGTATDFRWPRWYRLLKFKSKSGLDVFVSLSCWRFITDLRHWVLAKSNRTNIAYQY